jgi:putative ABC transport system ATP-binding protein
MIVCEGITKVYEGSGAKALDEVSFSIEEGTFTAITGKSGSGKTTLLNILAALDRPSSGVVTIHGRRITGLGERELSRWRGAQVGVVFQFFQLLPTLTVVENVLLPMEFSRTIEPRHRYSRALALLDQFGIADQAGKLPHTLSGGQQQRTAIARALANDPPLLVADEPTGNLDSTNSVSVLGLFAGLAAQGKTVVMITHETDYGRFARRHLTLKDGRLVPEASHA